jgi:hypothetical protein
VNESTQVVTQIQQEFKQKIDSIESKWKSIHESRVVEIQKQFDSKETEYKKTIEELTKTKTVSINEKHFTLEGGALSDREYYLHTTYDVWGPIFLGLHGEINKETDAKKVGLGVGIKF